jgi:hypothetical protein
MGALEITYLLLPAFLVCGALALSWRTLNHRWVFGVVGVLALTGLQFLIREISTGVYADNFIPVPREGTVAAIRAEDAISLAATTSAQMTIMLMWMVVLLLVSGVSLLWWLQRALRRPRAT